MTAKTLFELAGREVKPARIGEAVLVLIDYQNEYRDGPLRLDGVNDAVAKARTLLEAARRVGTRIVHIVHRGPPGGLFDRDAHRGAIIAELTPREGEAVIEKIRPNGFSETGLAEAIGLAGTAVIVAGFMTHNCVSSTVRAALDLGYVVTVAGDACATRDLPAPDGIVKAADLQRAELAGLADRHAAIADVRMLLRSTPSASRDLNRLPKS